MKFTTFNSVHKKLNAKMVEFAGFHMPVYYSSIVEEHLTVRNSIGVFDVSHMGEIFIKGKNSLDFVQKITTNDASKLEFGRVQYSAMCYENGGIVDDLLVYKLEDGFMFVVNASNLIKDFEWMKLNQLSDVEINDLSDDYSLLAVQGPKSAEVLSSLVDFNINELKYYTFRIGKIIGIEVIISRTGYTGELGFEIYFKGDDKTAEKIWNAIFDSGKTFDIKPAGLGSRDSLRLEMGFCLYGHDIDQLTNPLEAGLGWITKLNKKSFIGKEELTKIKAKGLNRSLFGFELIEKGIPRHGSEIYLKNERIGRVTSGVHSPSLNKPIGLGYFDMNKVNSDTLFDIDIRGRKLKAKLTEVPFIKK
ncbi:MAG: glycine cleavage system aminomethyltransferase GcvT [Ignavibacteria bacterium]|nr:glycine cleavage system aminomethyltransferase GcvT [Ignavibacteria bacterium]